MRYSLVYKKTAASELLKLPTAVALRIKPAIDGLIYNPRPSGCKKLKGFESSFRIRVGNYRVIYTISDAILIITIVKIAHRKSAY